MKYYGKELYHHGIKGQKWGVRNGPPYPLDARTKSKSEILNGSSSDFSISSKRKLYRISQIPNETIDERRKYVSFRPNDRRSYGRLYNDDVVLNVMRLRPVKDIKVAGYSTSAKLILKSMGDKTYREISDKMSPDEIARKIYNKYGHDHYQFDKLDLLDNDRNIFKELSKKGYDAMVDIHDVTTGFAELPLILLNPKESVSLEEVYDIFDDRYDSEYDNPTYKS